ncbi:O-antigen ligase family protein [Roseateles saccharophilus]|nr:O-antigen ligase family protein [Roseateles saccharophilus]
MPFYSSLSGSAHNDARLAQIPLFLLGTVVLFIGQKNLPNWTSFQQLTTTILVILAGISCSLAKNHGAALRECTLWISLATLSAAVFIACFQNKTIKFIMQAITLAWLVYSAFFFLAWVANLLAHGETHFWLAVPGFDNPRFLNHAQTIAIPLLAAATIHTDKCRTELALSWIALCLCFAMLMALVARASTVSLILGTAAAVVVFGRAAFPLARRILLGGAIGFLIYLLIFQGIPHWFDLKTISSPHTPADLVSDHSRIYLWKIALYDVAKAPLIGVGPMHYSADFNGRGAHPHNIYLQLIAEFGVPFFVLLTTATVVLARRSLRHIRQTSHAPDTLTVATTAALVAALVDGTFSGNFVVPMAQIWICLAAGLFFASTNHPISTPGTTRGINLLAVVALLGILSLQLLFSVETIQEYIHKPITIDNRPALPGAEANSPRFWLDGWL